VMSVEYRISAQGTIERVWISVFGTSSSTLNNFDYASRTLSVGGISGFREKVSASVQVSSGAALADLQFNTNPQAEMPEVRFVFEPSNATFEASFEVKAAYDTALLPGDVASFEASSIFESRGVNYVLADKLRVREVEWFGNDRAHYRLAYQNFGVALFEVIP